MSRCTIRSVMVLTLSPKLGLPTTGRQTHFGCQHKKTETGAWISGVFRCSPCYRRARRTYAKYVRELEKTL
jgi:hypothetical protein